MNRKERQQAAWTTAATIMTLAWPTIVEQVMQTAVQYIDTAMVGSLGTQATAAVGATSTIAWLVGSTFSALGVGFLALIAKACGAGDLEAAKKAAAQTSLVVLVAGIFATIVCTAVSGMVPVWMQVDPAVQELAGTYFFILYLPMLFRSASILFGTVLRAAGDTKTPMWVGIIVNCINIVLNFLLIYDTRTVSLLGLRFAIPGAGWGVTGAAAGTLISRVGSQRPVLRVGRYPHHLGSLAAPLGLAQRHEPETRHEHSAALRKNCFPQYAPAFWNLFGVCGFCRDDQFLG